MLNPSDASLHLSDLPLHINRFPFKNLWSLLDELASPIHRRGSAKTESELSSLHSPLDEFHAAVLGTADIGLVVCHRLMRALTHGTEVKSVDP